MGPFRASPIKRGRRDTPLRFLVIALVVVLLLTFAVGCGAIKKVVDQAVVTWNGYQSLNAINAKASDGYDVTLARSKWHEALAAYNEGDYSRAGRLVDEANDALKDVKKVAERIYHESSDGLTVSGLLFKPENSEGPWPAIIVNHAGFGTAGDLSHVALMIRDRGYLVFNPDFRGSGESEGKHELAKGEVDDVIHAIDYLKSSGLVEDDRIGMFGQSHGAAVSLIAAGRDPRIKAVVAEAGFTDLFAMAEYAETLTDPQMKKLADEAMRMLGGLPEEVPEEYKVRSAVNYVDSVQASILLIHGGKDQYVPVDQAELMAEALRESGKIVELKIYPDEAHGVSGAHRAEVWDMMFAWFEKYV